MNLNKTTCASRRSERAAGEARSLRDFGDDLAFFMARMLVVLAIVFVVGRPIHAQTPTPAPSSVPVPTMAAPASLDHVIELTGQLDQRLLTTVYWCLGTLVTVFLLLIGFNWFANFRLNEREIGDLKRQIATGLEAAIRNLTVTNKEEGRQLREQLTATADQAVSAKLSSIQSTVSGLQSAVSALQASNLQIEVDKWIQQKVYSNAVRTHIDYLRKCQATGNTYDLNNGLDKLERIFKLMLSADPRLRPDAADIANISRFLDSIAEKNPVIVNRLRDLVNDICR